MDATSKTPGAGGRRGFQDHAYLDALGQLYGKPRSYCGCMPNPAPAARDPLTVASELYQAAECLADLAEDFAAGEYDARALSSADALLVGCEGAFSQLGTSRETYQAFVVGDRRAAWKQESVRAGRWAALGGPLGAILFFAGVMLLKRRKPRVALPGLEPGRL